MAYERFNADNAAMLLIDHQVGTIEWMHSAPKKDVIRNTLALAKTAKELGMPVVLASSQEDQTQGLLLPELKELLPEAYKNRVKRGGIVDAFDDPNFTGGRESHWPQQANHGWVADGGMPHLSSTECPG